MKKIIVYCEVDYLQNTLSDVSYELISKAYDLSKKAFEISYGRCSYAVEAVALCDVINEYSIKKAFEAGAARFVFLKDKCLSVFSQTVFAQCFIEYFNQNPASIILFPATKTGRILAPRITTALNTGLVADCTGLDFITKDNKLIFAPTRPTFGSELMATIISKTTPQCATIRPNTFEANFTRNIDGQFYEFHPTSYEENRIRILRSIMGNKDSIDFANARVVLAAGYGLADGKDRKYFARLEKIAETIGVKVASTRKVVDLGLMPQETQIGQTGATTNADLYVAFGISGAIQHVCGMKNCKKIIAVNTDENAEIFKYADYKVVYDAKKMIDEILAQVIS